MPRYGMDEKMRIMSEKPLNAETPHEYLRSWITANSKFFARNQAQIPARRADLSRWRLSVEGEVEFAFEMGYEDILGMARSIRANTLECSGNGRSLLTEKARGNPWTIGGVGNAVWGGVLLGDILKMAMPKEGAGHVSFEGFDKPLGSAGIRFIRSIPLAKALTETLLAYEMNGDPLPPKHGFPLRALVLGWTGVSSVKWLNRIIVRKEPYNGFYMDKVYRIFGRGEAPEEGTVVTALKVKSVITRPLSGERLPKGPVNILGAAWAGEADIAGVEVSTDGGESWAAAELIGPSSRFAWRQWQHPWKAIDQGRFTLLSRATDTAGNVQPERASWNVLGYGNNGVREHAVTVEIS